MTDICKFFDLIFNKATRKTYYLPHRYVVYYKPEDQSNNTKTI